MSTTTRNDVRQLAEKIESLAKQVQDKLNNNSSDLLPTANELVRNNLTFVFALGEIYALEQVGGGKPVKAKVAKASNKSAKWHNVRDSFGRFTKKV